MSAFSDIQSLIDKDVCDRLEAGHDVAVDDIAKSVFFQICKTHVGHHVEWATLETIKKMVRSRCQMRFDPKILTEEKQQDIFDKRLQEAYPTKVKGLYRRTDRLSYEELTAIDTMLRKAGNSLIQHADTVMAFRDSKFPQALAS